MAAFACNHLNSAIISRVSLRNGSLNLKSTENVKSETRFSRRKHCFTIAMSIQPTSKTDTVARGFDSALPAFVVFSATSFFSLPLVAQAAEQVSCSDEQSSNTAFIIACVAEFIALTGAAVGGVLARQRKDELEVINAQLRQINLSLRKQARVESYAPSLSYAPVGARKATSVSESTLSKDTVLQHLKAGKRFLREQNPVQAAVKFEEALKLARELGDFVEQKKAARGLGASFQRQGKLSEAITYHQTVLDISKDSGESSGDTEAYGAIADIYTELGDLERAAVYYDKYIGRLTKGEENQD